jgi:hypothetical protein
MKKIQWVLILLIPIGMFIFSLYSIIHSPPSEWSGWLQVILASLAIPIIYYELTRIQHSFNQKPMISIGVASVNDLPLSKIRNLGSLSTSTNIGHGYSVFWLAIRNSGQVAARNIKIHVEYRTPAKPKPNLFSPVITVGDWLGDNRFTFKKVNNADFVFIGGQDWILHSNDTDMFDFGMTTSIVKQTKPHEIRERPALGSYEFFCTIWADGLDKPVTEKLVINIIPSIKPTKESIESDS